MFYLYVRGGFFLELIIFLRNYLEVSRQNLPEKGTERWKETERHRERDIKT
jgi:hypothetical protein